MISERVIYLLTWWWWCWGGLLKDLQHFCTVHWSSHDLKHNPESAFWGKYCFVRKLQTAVLMNERANIRQMFSTTFEGNILWAPKGCANHYFYLLSLIQHIQSEGRIKQTSLYCFPVKIFIFFLLFKCNLVCAVGNWTLQSLKYPYYG